MPIRLGNLPYDLLVSGDDFTTHGTTENMIFSGVVLFITLYTLEISTQIVLSLMPSSLMKEPGVPRKLARNLNEGSAMVVMSWLGYVAFVDMGGFALATTGIPHEKLYIFNAFSQRLVLFQAAYEVKNFINSLISGDGIVFLFHHLFTGLVSVFAMRPFLHYYAAYFLGLSEVSTIFLCIHCCFDEKFGSKTLVRMFPTAHTFLGLLFAVAFCIFRITLWIYFAFHMCTDLMAIHNSGHVHSYTVWAFYFISTILFTILQIVWLSDIVAAAKESFFPSAKAKKNA